MEIIIFTWAVGTLGLVAGILLGKGSVPEIKVIGPNAPAGVVPKTVAAKVEKVEQAEVLHAGPLKRPSPEDLAEREKPRFIKETEQAMRETLQDMGLQPDPIER